MNESLAARSLKTGTVAAILGSLWLCMVGHSQWGLGFLVGSALSLFSLFSLTVLVPMLIGPGRSRFSVVLLSITLFMKLPFYAIGLYVAVRLGGNNPLSALCGLALAPFVITLKAVSAAFMPERSARPARVTNLALRERLHVEPLPASLHVHAPARVHTAELVSEGG